MRVVSSSHSFPIVLMAKVILPQCDNEVSAKIHPAGVEFNNPAAAPRLGTIQTSPSRRGSLPAGSRKNQGATPPAPPAATSLFLSPIVQEPAGAGENSAAGWGNKPRPRL